MDNRQRVLARLRRNARALAAVWDAGEAQDPGAGRHQIEVDGELLEVTRSPCASCGDPAGLFVHAVDAPRRRGGKPSRCAACRQQQNIHCVRAWRARQSEDGVGGRTVYSGG